MKFYKSHLIYYLFKPLRVQKNMIVFYHNGFSGSNLSFIYDLEHKKNLSRYVLIDINEKIKGKSRLISILTSAYYYNKAKILLYTHGGRRVRLKKNQVVIELWHGFPLKGMNYMDLKDYTSGFKSFYSNYIISSSKLYNTFFNACMREDVSKFKVIGFPRNDYLFNTNGRRNLELLFNEKFRHKYVFLYMPTYRKSVNRTDDGKKIVDNIFNFPDFNWKLMNDFLKKNDILLLLKLHPFEEQFYIKTLIDEITSNVRLVNQTLLSDFKMDLYKIVNSSNLLITDYSSIYFDYLLLDKPILFTPSDLDQYSVSRGLLIEDYNFWTPGPKVNTMEDFLKYSMILVTEDGYSTQRKQLCNEIHRYKDSNSTKRLIEFINSFGTTNE